MFLDDGRVADRGTHAELLARNPAYARLVNAYERRRASRRPPTEPQVSAPVSTRHRDAGTRRRSGLARLAPRIRRGLELSPGAPRGLGGTVALAVLATAGRVVVPIAVQQTVDRGLGAAGGPDLTLRDAGWRSLAALGVVVTGVASYSMTARLFRAAERGLATLRVKAFRHVHDLPVLTQNTERRGALVSRVTSDVDQVSQFLVFGGVIAIVSVGQIVIATVVMLFYSWQLTLVVWICFLPLFLSLRYFQQRLSEAYGVVRRQVGAMLGAVSEPVVGAHGGPHLRRRGPHPGPDRRRGRAPPGGQHPGPGADRVLVLRSAGSPPGWPTPAS